MGSNISILVVDDEKNIREIIYNYLLQEGYSVKTASSAAEARALAEYESFDLVITDIVMPGEDGLSLARDFRRQYPACGIIFITGHPDIEKIPMVEEMEIAAFLVKPFTFEQFKYCVLCALEKRRRLQGEISAGSREGEEKDQLGLIGVSPYIGNLRRQILQMAAGEFPVLIQGDSGTGKEVIANAIHIHSRRAGMPIMTINCAAIPKHLEESEFFGYAKGAFTGADSVKQGIIAAADKSTLFLDEIGDISPEIQAKLLRVLDTGEFHRVGETTARTVDIRIISATNRDLTEMVEKGTFREDLFFRLRGAAIQTEPLVRHREDIPSLVRHFLGRQREPRVPKTITAEAMNVLLNYNWPGNIRELKYTIDFLCTASIGKKRINMAVIDTMMKVEGKNVESRQSYQEAKDSILTSFEIRYFTELLQRFRGNLNQAAKAAGMYRPNLIKKLKQLDISADDFRVKKKKPAEV